MNELDILEVLIRSENYLRAFYDKFLILIKNLNI